MKPKKMHKEGTATLLIYGAVVVIAAIILIITDVPLGVSLAIMVPLLIVYGITINFFRYPPRTFHGDELHDVIAPSDGTIVTIEEVMEPDYFKDRRIQISIFMSVTNVHAQWCPLNGDVIKSIHEDGHFKKAYLPKSSNENERSTIVIKSDAGPIIMMRQVAGAVARRIVTYLEAGDRSEINGELGFIKFGSRIDLFLPLDAEVLVKMGDKVRGNITTVAKI
ncbi:MAG: phosphatidylserine decarboxylase family protein [Bacteroidales bacterium]|nr:phosphatidylserine decarboxylase family protein [Bacteroidales bacterium]